MNKKLESSTLTSSSASISSDDLLLDEGAVATLANELSLEALESASGGWGESWDQGYGFSQGENLGYASQSYYGGNSYDVAVNCRCRCGCVGGGSAGGSQSGFDGNCMGLGIIS